MPKYQAPGVHVEEVGFRAKPIVGVPTSTCAFVGPTLTGPVGKKPVLVTSFSDYVRTFGGLEDLGFSGVTQPLHRRNYMAHAARAFFTNGGQRLYVARVLAGASTRATSRLPDAAAYTATFTRLDRLDEVSIVAAPGYSAFADLADGALCNAIQTALLVAVSGRMRFRMAVLDAPPAVAPTKLRELRERVDSSQAALYYPWVISQNPLAGTSPAQAAEISLPPSGFVCGIYARNDTERGVHKAPANELVAGALRPERELSRSDQELLNPMGVNCLRTINNQGLRVWGARTTSSDPEFKYVNVRRYLNYLGASLSRGTQWAVFEPNGEGLWANVRDTINNFLYNEWRNGALLGSQARDAWFVRCDRSTMTQNDLELGQLVCLIGVAMVKPAEFVTLRIGQLTADAKPQGIAR